MDWNNVITTIISGVTLIVLGIAIAQHRREKRRDLLFRMKVQALITALLKYNGLKDTFNKELDELKKDIRWIESGG